MIDLTKQQARQFLLRKHGLLGEYQFIGKQGALDFIRQTGCIQFDPIDACGKNAELTLQSRVKGFTKNTLYDLLYKDRSLFDYPDKNLSIISVDDWPYFHRYRQAAREGGLTVEGLGRLEQMAMDYIREQGPVSSDEIPIEGSIQWQSSIHWSGDRFRLSAASRSVLEQLYSTGDLVIHHKNGTRKYYDLAERYIPDHLLNAADPLPVELEHQQWRVKRRIGAVGLLWNRPSDAWLNIWGMKSSERNEIFRRLLEENEIQELKIEGIRDIFYLCSKDLPIVEGVLAQNEWKPRCELLAPLDCMLWDRKVIRALFDFDYTWEIYTPVSKRKYGYYVLPLLYGDQLIGRVEAVADKKNRTLTVKHIWYEEGRKLTKKIQASVNVCLRRLAEFNECSNLLMP